MTEGEGAKDETRIVLAIETIPQSNLDACARVFARLVVEKALSIGMLDIGPTIEDDAVTQHKAAPPGARTPNGAKEQVT